jgi:hypothetical protein
MSYDKQSSRNRHPSYNMLPLSHLAYKSPSIFLQLPQLEASATNLITSNARRPLVLVISKARHQQALSAINADHLVRRRPRIPNLGFSCTHSTVFPREAAYCRAAIVTYRSLCLGISLPGENADLAIVFFVSSCFNTGAPRGIATHLGNWRTGEETGSWILGGDPGQARNDFIRTKSEWPLLNGSLRPPSTLLQRAQRQSGSFLGEYERRRISLGIRSLLKLLATLLPIGVAQDGSRGV